MRAIAAALSVFFILINPYTVNAHITAENHPQSSAMCAKLPMSADGIVHLSRVEVDPAYLDEYMKFAVEVGEISLRT